MSNMSRWAFDAFGRVLQRYRQIWELVVFAAQLALNNAGRTSGLRWRPEIQDQGNDNSKGERKACPKMVFLGSFHNFCVAVLRRILLPLDNYADIEECSSHTSLV